jgi:hypothetical protein
MFTGFLSGEGYSLDRIGDVLEGEFDGKVYPVKPSDSSRDHIKASFGLSFLVAEELSQVSDKPYFFRERAKDFKEFYKEVGHAPNYSKNEVLQMANLYTGLADFEGFEMETESVESLVLAERSEAVQEVADMISDLSEFY